MDEKYLMDVYSHCKHNRDEIENSKICGCFYCQRTFNPNEIRQWIKDDMLTAKCPYCNIDSVIGDGSGYKITKEILKSINKKWF